MEKFPWLEIARSRVGLREIKGKEHNSFIVKMWKSIKRGGIKDDETPWCAAFVGECLEEAGIVSTRFEGAGSYLTWGVPCNPCYGAVVVIKTNSGTGNHVGFLVGQDTVGNVFVLGGNQNNEVNVSKYPASRIKATRWPKPLYSPDIALPVIAGQKIDYSTSEA